MMSVMKKIWIVAVMALAGVLLVVEAKALRAGEMAWQVIFQSGFGPGVRGKPADAHATLLGRDTSVKTLGDWEKDLVGHEQIGKFWIQYQGGDASQRWARLIEDPDDKKNRVLKYWLQSPNVGGEKGRIQAVISGTKDFKAFRTSVRMKLGPGFKVLESAPSPVKWLTIQEYWNNAVWGGEDFPFRVTLNFRKPEKTPGHPLRFGAHGQIKKNGKWKHVWDYENRSDVVPIGEWFTLDTTFIEGNKSTGRFVVSITAEGQKPKTVIDIRDATHHPDDPAPDGVRQLNPLKLYTSAALLEYVRGRGESLEILWDDFSLSLPADN